MFSRSRTLARKSPSLAAKYLYSTPSSPLVKQKQAAVAREWKTLANTLSKHDFYVDSVNVMGALKTQFCRHVDATQPPGGGPPILGCPFASDVICTIQESLADRSAALKKVTNNKLRGPFFGAPTRIEPFRTLWMDRVTELHVDSCCHGREFDYSVILDSESETSNGTVDDAFDFDNAADCQSISKTATVSTEQLKADCCDSSKEVHIVEMGAGLDFRLERIAMKSLLATKAKEESGSANTDSNDHNANDSTVVVRNCDTLPFVQKLKAHKCSVFVHDVDLEEVMDLRTPLLNLVRLKSGFDSGDSVVDDSEHSAIRHRPIVKSTYHCALVDAIKSGMPLNTERNDFSNVLFITEALFLHLTQLERVELVQKLADSFPNATMVCDETLTEELADTQNVFAQKQWHIYEEETVQRRLPLWFKMCFGYVCRKCYHIAIFKFRPVL